MELVRGIDTDVRRRAIVRAVVGMCRELDTLVIAEGIETEAEAATLRDLGIRYHQGFWYARPAVELRSSERSPAISLVPMPKSNSPRDSAARLAKASGDRKLRAPFARCLATAGDDPLRPDLLEA